MADGIDEDDSDSREASHSGSADDVDEDAFDTRGGGDPESDVEGLRMENFYIEDDERREARRAEVTGTIPSDSEVGH